MNRLKLIAFDAEDLGIIAAHVQDAVLKVGDMKFEPASGRFFMQLNRFVWERAEKEQATGSYERRKTVLHFERVTGVQVLNLDQKNRDTVLDLLTLQIDEKKPASDPAETIEIIFAGGATLRLTVECIEAQLSDMAGSWETTSRPAHEGASDAS